jgi:transposase
VSWRKIKAEYIAGGISQRAVAEKYGVPYGTLQRRAIKEKWNPKRKAAEAKAMEKVSEKTAESVADNAVLLQNIKAKLLRKLSDMVDAYPDANAAEIKHRTKGTEIVYRMRDIAAVYAALEDKTFKANIDIEDLSPLGELLRDD